MTRLRVALQTHSCRSKGGTVRSARELRTAAQCVAGQRTDS
jgi:hypothetical protein